MGYRIINGVSYPAVGFPIGNEVNNKAQKTPENTQGKSFDDILKTKINQKNGFTISNHAAERMEDVNFNTVDMNKINEAINKADEKGAKNCLIVYKDVALVTSVQNRTVITAVGGSRAKDNVFTNVDSVILL
jgi:flagellar operon protein